jgi:hypothetical protein
LVVIHSVGLKSSGIIFTIQAVVIVAPLARGSRFLLPAPFLELGFPVVLTECVAVWEGCAF